MQRKIVQIHEDKCNGCGLCATACHEGAIEMVNGKARLVSDKYCDGFGDCLPACPTGAIEIIVRDADEYDQEAVDQRLEAMKGDKEKAHAVSETSPLPTLPTLPCGCPGTMEKSLKVAAAPEKRKPESQAAGEVPSELIQWPVQLRLVSVNADFLKGADILIAADCTAYAYGDFHRKFMKDRVTIIACPKLDDNDYNTEKLTEIFKNNDIRSILVTRMQVPCCSGITAATKEAIRKSGKIIPYAEVTISSDGKVLL